MARYMRTLLVIACLGTAGQDALAIAPRSNVVASQATDPPAKSTAARTSYTWRDSEFEILMAFGAGVSALLLLCRTYQHEGRAFAVGTVLFSSMASLYGFLQGAWPLGIALGAYSVVSLRALILSRRGISMPRLSIPPGPARNTIALQPWEQSRMSRMFGPGN
jgi:hypothetical protein